MTTVTRTLHATPLHMPTLRATCNTMAFVRVDLWRLYGALGCVGKRVENTRKEVTTGGWDASLAVDGTIRAEATKEAVNDILTYKEAACKKVRQARRTSDSPERERLYMLLKHDKRLEDMTSV